MAAEVRIPELLQVSHVGTDTHVLGLSSACSDVLAGRWIRSGQLSLELVPIWDACSTGFTCCDTMLAPVYSLHLSIFTHTLCKSHEIGA